jgi:predicted MFS family arabinose efflux permease
MSRAEAGPYRGLLAVPGVGAQAVSGLLAQLTQIAAVVGLVLVTRAANGSLVLAGVEAGAFSVALGIARPIQGRLIDRRGPRPVLLASAALHVGALLGLVAGIGRGAPGWALVALAAVAGLGLPPISTCMRVEWGRRAPDSLRTAAYSLVYLVQELAIMAGPLLLGAIVAVAPAALALTVVTLTAGLGTVAFALVSTVERREPDAVARASGVLRDPGMRLLLAIAGLLGTVFGTLQVGLTALALAGGRPALSGVLAAALSLGGALGAIGYGARRWSARPARRLVVLLCAIGLALAPVTVLRSLPLIGLLLCAAGMALNPSLTTSSLLVDELVPSSPAEAFGWLSTAFSLGAAAGSAMAGLVAEGHGARTAIAIAPLLAFATAALGAAAEHRLTARADPPPGG